MTPGPRRQPRSSTRGSGTRRLAAAAGAPGIALPANRARPSIPRPGLAPDCDATSPCRSPRAWYDVEQDGNAPDPTNADGRRGLRRAAALARGPAVVLRLGHARGDRRRPR